MVAGALVAEDIAEGGGGGDDAGAVVEAGVAAGAEDADKAGLIVEESAACAEEVGEDSDLSQGESLGEELTATEGPIGRAASGAIEEEMRDSGVVDGERGEGRAEEIVGDDVRVETTGDGDRKGRGGGSPSGLGATTVDNKEHK